MSSAGASTIGLANLPLQVQRRAIRRGFRLTVMVAGDSSLGKSTLINTLFNSPIFNTDTASSSSMPASSPTKDSVGALDAATRTLGLEESGVQLTVTVIETPGYSWDRMTLEESAAPLVKVVQDRFAAHLEAESSNSRPVQDNRVTCCVYVISPSTGLRLRDIVIMQKLEKYVNLIPVIGKADTLTVAETRRMKQRILKDLDENEVHYYKAPFLDMDSTGDKALMHLPFAVVGATDTDMRSGQSVRSRKYPWGSVEVDNPDHCDVKLLQDVIIRSNFLDLVDRTNSLFEDYRLDLEHRCATADGIPGRASLDSAMGATNPSSRSSLVSWFIQNLLKGGEGGIAPAHTRCCDHAPENLCESISEQLELAMVNEGYHDDVNEASDVARRQSQDTAPAIETIQEAILEAPRTPPLMTPSIARALAKQASIGSQG